MVTETKHRNRRLAAVLAIAFGMLGVHKFYVGNWRAGLAQLGVGVAAAAAAGAMGIMLPCSVVGALAAVEVLDDVSACADPTAL